MQPPDHFRQVYRQMQPPHHFQQVYPSRLLVSCPCLAQAVLAAQSGIYCRCLVRLKEMCKDISR